MSVYPIPATLGCMGFSQDAIASTRYAAPTAGTSWNDRVAAARSTFAAKQAKGGSVPATASGSGQHTPGAGAAQPAGAQTAPPPSLNPVRLSTMEARTLLGANTSPTRRTAGLCCHSKQQQAENLVLSTVDLAVIADSSTGGAGIPRPYGKFVAARGGNGTAMWQRLPPQAGTWRAKALPVAITVVDDEELAIVETAAAVQQQRNPSPPDSPQYMRAPPPLPEAQQGTAGPSVSSVHIALDESTLAEVVAAAEAEEVMRANATPPAHSHHAHGGSRRGTRDAHPSSPHAAPGASTSPWGSVPSTAYGNARGSLPSTAGGGAGYAMSAAPVARTGYPSSSGAGLPQQQPGQLDMSYMRLPSVPRLDTGAGAAAHGYAQFAADDAGASASGGWGGAAEAAAAEEDDADDESSTGQQWFALPCATFLTSAPHLPPSVRVDAGYRSSRRFMKKGLRQQSDIYPQEYFDRSVAHFRRKPGSDQAGSAFNSIHGTQRPGSGSTGAGRRGGGASLPQYVGVYVPQDARARVAAERAQAEAAARQALQAGRTPSSMDLLKAMSYTSYSVAAARRPGSGPHAPAAGSDFSRSRSMGDAGAGSGAGAAAAASTAGAGAHHPPGPSAPSTSTPHSATAGMRALSPLPAASPRLGSPRSPSAAAMLSHQGLDALRPRSSGLATADPTSEWPALAEPRITSLPSEASLPRRNVPPKW